MSTIRPISPSERWLRQGEMLARLKQQQEAKNKGTWMNHYRQSLQHEFRFSERSEQLCRQGWKLWTFALDNGFRTQAENLLASTPHVNEFMDELKLLKADIYAKNKD